MNKIIKIVIIFLFVVLGLLFGYLAFNLIDAAAPTDEFTQNDIQPADFAKENGFYILWGLGEPAGVNIFSEQSRLEIRRLFAPGYDNCQAMAEYEKNKQKRKDYLKSLWGWSDKIFPSNDGNLFSRNGWTPFFKKNRELIQKIYDEWEAPLARYERLLNSTRFNDFTLPRFDSPIPNLLFLLQLSKLSAAHHTLQAFDGQWIEGVQALIRQVDLGKRIVSDSRTLILNLIGKAIALNSLRCIICIMNEKDCPAELFSLVLEKLPPLSRQEYGCRQSFACEYLAIAPIFGKKEMAPFLGKEKDPWYSPFTRWLLQKNRTKRAYLDFHRQLIHLEEMDPTQWKEEDFRMDTPVLKPFWWLQNPIGNRSIVRWLPNLKQAIFKSYRLRIIHELTRILAELNLKYTPEKPINQILPTLFSYGSLDPFTGKSYRYDEAKQLLYSLGWDRIDNNGIEDNSKFIGIDIPVPCIPFYRPTPLPSH